VVAGRSTPGALVRQSRGDCTAICPSPRESAVEVAQLGRDRPGRRATEERAVRTAVTWSTASPARYPVPTRRDTA